MDVELRTLKMASISWLTMSHLRDVAFEYEMYTPITMNVRQAPAIVLVPSGGLGDIKKGCLLWMKLALCFVFYINTRPLLY